jgi:hypothetical protein
MKRHGIVAGEPDHRTRRAVSTTATPVQQAAQASTSRGRGERVGQHVDREAEVEPPRGLRRLPRRRRGAETGVNHRVS